MHIAEQGEHVCMRAPGRQLGIQLQQASNRTASKQKQKHLQGSHCRLQTLMLTGLPLMSGWAAPPSGPRNHHWRPDLSFTGQASTTSALPQGLTDR